MKCKTCHGNAWIWIQIPAKEAWTLDEDGEKVYPYPDKDYMLDYGYPCPDCNGGEAIVERKKEKAQLPASFYDAEIKDFNWGIYMDDAGKQIDTAKQKEFVDSFIADFKIWQDHGIGLYIWSRIKGSGKTFLASAICNTLIRNNHLSPLFASAANLISLDEEKKTQELIDCDLMVIDDLGAKTGGKEWQEDILFKILDARMQKKKLVIITSNLRMEQLPYGDRVGDRLFRMMQPLPLPDYCVRAKEAKSEKLALLKKLGLIGKKPEQMTIEGVQK